MYEIKKEPLGSSVDNRESLFTGPCCCCMELFCRKSIWSQYHWMGCTEIYGNMLQECFGLTITQEQNVSTQICEVCITHLRNTLYFRRQVLQCQAKLQIAAQKYVISILPETNDTENNEEHDSKSLSIGPEENIDDFKEQKAITSVLPDEKDMDNNNKQDSKNLFVGTAELDSEAKVIKTKRRVVKRHNITNGKRVNPKCKREEKETNYVRTRQNICLILEHSTLVPFKSSNSYFNCFYCNKQYVVFEELTNHVAVEHRDLKSEEIRKCILRPHVVKADISNASCKICSTKMDTVGDLVNHLREVHSVAFNYEDQCKPEDSIVPYNLSEGKYRCSVCGNEFLFFKTLTKHMNEHSTNHVCDICGKCFLLPERLRAHRQIHTNNSAVKCELCGKICTSSMLLRSHIRYSHKKVPYSCSICNESFPTFKGRMTHMEAVHGRRTVLNCSSCGKSFKSLGRRNAHMRAEHLKIRREPKFSCADCPMKFKSKSSLESHQVVHSGERNFECEVCHKRYGRAKTLVEHLKIHSNDRRWACADCGQAFIQKCSLINHIRVHHGARDSAKLIQYKKPDK